MADVGILPIKQRKGIIRPIAISRGWNQLCLIGRVGRLPDVIVDFGFGSSIKEIAAWNFIGVLAVALHEQILDAKEIIQNGSVINLTQRDVGLILSVLQRGAELSQILVLQGVV